MSLEMLATTLAAEHAAVYVLGVLGGRVKADADPGLAALLRAAYDTHQARRDQLVSLIEARGARPVPAAAAYQLRAVTRAPGVLADRAAQVETRATAVYADLVAASTDEVRSWALSALTDAAVRSLGFGASPTAFPGAPELS